MARLNREQLEALRRQARRRMYTGEGGPRTRVMVHMGSCGIAAGARAIEAAFREEFARSGLHGAVLMSTGCSGLCSEEPMATVEMPQSPPIRYGGLTAEKARRVFREHIEGGNPVAEHVIGVGYEPGILTPEEISSLLRERLIDNEQLGPLETKGGATLPPLVEHPFFKKQKLVVLRNKGMIDPELIDDYIARDGYTGIEKALAGMSPDQVIAEIEAAGLRGRGGAGFPTGLKWAACRREDRSPGSDQDDAMRLPKYLIANCDEGDPGAYMDRSLLESDPHAVIEGMAIAAYAIGAAQGYVYVRSEYPLAIRRMEIAIAQAKDYGLLGEDILGSGFSFDIDIREGSGAFVCGEETSLIHSIEGESPEPTQRPPFPVQMGAWGRPTVINNVETLANVPLIITRGSPWFSHIGTETSKGTKIFSLVGKINNAGLIEVPMGITLREIIEEVGGGIPGGRQFKALQTGGPSGGCIPADLIDVSIDYESLKAAGSMMGSGGMIVMDEDTCMVDVAKFFVQFTNDESCGKCSTCREGSEALLDILTRITKGEGRPEDLDLLSELGAVIKDASMCGLGTTIPNPVLSTLRYFRGEYEAHIQEKACPARACRDLIRYWIDPDRCPGCQLCLKACPGGAIQGSSKQPHIIDTSRCTKCGECFDVCPPKVRAVRKLTGKEITGLHDAQLEATQQAQP